TRATGTPPSAGCSRSATSPGSATPPTAGRRPGTAAMSARTRCDSEGRSNLNGDQDGAGMPGGVFEVLAVAFVAVFGFVNRDAAPGRRLAVLVALALLLDPGVGEAGPDGVVQVEAFAVPGRDDRVRGDVRVVGGADRAVRPGQGRAGRQRGAVGVVEREGAARGGRGGDGVAAVVDHLVVPGAQADQVVQVGGAAIDPVLDVVQVGPAGLAARVPAPAVVPFAGGAADRGAGAAPAAAQGQDRAGVAVGHPGQGGGAGEHLRGGHADGRAVLDVASGRIRGRGRFRGNAGRVRSRV